MSVIKPSYPWAEGDALFADELNAAIANAASASTIPPGGSIQAAIDALPATGGEVRLSPNTTYVITTAIVSHTNNVHLSAPGWGSVIQRGPALAGTMLQFFGTGCLIQGMTLDGNGVANTSGQAEIQVIGAHSRITNIHVINSSSVIVIAVSGDTCRVDHCTITGRGVDLMREQGEGIWCDATNQVTIDHNTISGTGLNAISSSGNGTIIESNVLTNCRCYAGGPGGIIVVYPNNTPGTSTRVCGNLIRGCGSNVTHGIETYGDHLTISDNVIFNMYGSAISVGNVGTSRGSVITGNTIVNVGLDESGLQDAIIIGTGVTDFVISGNRIDDTHTPPKVRWAVAVSQTPVDRYVISNNLFCTTSSYLVINDVGFGIHKTLGQNTGLDTSQQGAYFPTPSTMRVAASSTFHLVNPGTLVPITAIDTFNSAAGIMKTVFPNAAFVFTAGNNINNTITTTANVPFTMTCDETGKWWLR